MAAESAKSLIAMIEAAARRPVRYEALASDGGAPGPLADPAPAAPDGASPPAADAGPEAGAAPAEAPPVAAAFVPADPGAGAGEAAGENPDHREDFMALLRKAWRRTAGRAALH